MKCKCGNKIDIKLGAKVKCQGCHILTSMTTRITAKCGKCGEVFQVPVLSGEYIAKQEELDL